MNFDRCPVSGPFQRGQWSPEATTHRPKCPERKTRRAILLKPFVAALTSRRGFSFVVVPFVLRHSRPQREHLPLDLGDRRGRSFPKGCSINRILRRFLEISRANLNSSSPWLSSFPHVRALRSVRSQFYIPTVHTSFVFLLTRSVELRIVPRGC